MQTNHIEFGAKLGLPAYTFTPVPPIPSSSFPPAQGNHWLLSNALIMMNIFQIVSLPRYFQFLSPVVSVSCFLSHNLEEARELTKLLQ